MNDDYDWVPGHLARAYAPYLGLVGGEQWTVRQSTHDTRFSADIGENRISVDVRRARYENASEFRAWLPLSGAAFRAATSPRPENWHLYTLVIGELPDGSPWWTALWDLDVIRRHPDVAENMNDGRWYRVSPKDVPVGERPARFDFVQADMGLVPAPSGVLSGVLDLEQRLASAADDELVDVDQVLLRVRRSIRSEREKRAAVAVGGA